MPKTFKQRKEALQLQAIRYAGSREESVRYHAGIILVALSLAKTHSDLDRLYAPCAEYVTCDLENIIEAIAKDAEDES